MTKRLIAAAPDDVARLLGLEPESDEAAKMLQEILDRLDEQKKFPDGQYRPQKSRSPTVDGWEV